MKRLDKKVALVTGASKGIGAEIAKELADQGAKVAINYNGSQEEAEEVVEAIRNSNGEAIAIQADVSKIEEVKSMFDQTIEHFGKVDVLVNNAGIMITKPLKLTSEDEFDLQFAVNVKGVFNTLKEANDKLADNGSIINLSTTVKRLMLPGYATYAATKGAVEQFTRVFSREVGRGITVNAVSPGPTNTKLFMKGKPQEVVDKLASLNPLGRIGEPDDTAAVVVFLASDDAKWVNAQDIGTNGGMA